jgi:hypothetical protein
MSMGEQPVAEGFSLCDHAAHWVEYTLDPKFGGVFWFQIGCLDCDLHFKSSGALSDERRVAKWESSTRRISILQMAIANLIGIGKSRFQKRR